MDDNHVLKLTAAQLDDALNKALNALPRDGSAEMTGALTIKNTGPTLYLKETDTSAQARVFVSGKVLNVEVRDVDRDANNLRALYISPKSVYNDVADALLLITSENGTVTINKVLHTGNKPSGTYTGNGSAASRTIDIGGIGSTLRINGNNCVLFVTASGAICKYADNTIVGISGGECNFSSGVLTLATTNEAINKNGTKFYYEVL